MRRIVYLSAAAVFVLLALAGLSPAPAADKDKGKSPQPTHSGDDANELSLDVSALGMLRRLKATPAQMRAIAKLAAPPAKDVRQKAKASARYVKALADLRAALVKGDEKQIDDLEDKAEE